LSVKSQKTKGFTLLELMIAIFILAMGVAILLGTESTSMRLMGYSNNLSVVNLLTRAKMQDIEYELQQDIAKNGPKEDLLLTDSGDYRDEGYPDIRWESQIQSIEIDDDASNNFVEDVSAQLYGGGGDESGSLSGNLAITQFLPIMVSLMPQILNQLGRRIRKITLNTTWDYLGMEQSLTISQFVVVLEVDSSLSGASVSKSKDSDE
jgi:prepilin-type N-terminal cleavage/methylation domain-containing protein